MQELDPSEFEIIDDESSGLEELDASEFEEIPPGMDGSAPRAALPESPVGLLDRVKLSFGNQKGGMEYLRKTYKEVSYDNDKGIVVNDGGTWKQVDPDFMDGDGWEATRDIATALRDIKESATDVVEAVTGNALQMGGQALGATAGGVAGGAGGAALGMTTANPAAALGGLVVGAGAGGFVGSGAGGAAGEGVRTYLGRALGTYQATDEEQLSDIALEGIFSAGGEAVRLGVKPGLSALRKGFKTIGDKASPVVKDILAATYGRLTQAGEDATRVMFDRTDDVLKKLGAIKAQGARGSSEIMSKGAEMQLSATNEFLDVATEALPRKYGELLSDLSKEAGEKGFKADISDVVTHARNSFLELGFGKMDDAGRFVALSDDDLARRAAQGMDIENAALDRKAFREVKALFDTLGKFEKIGELKGEQAVKALTKINSLLNSVKKDAYKNGSPTLQRAATQASASWRTGLGKQFSDQGLGEQYLKLSDLYSKYGSAVETARNAMKQGGEGFMNKMLSGAGRNAKAKGEAELLVELAGKRGEQLFDDIVITETAKRFSPVWPKFGLMAGGQAQLGGMAAAGYSAGLPGVIAAGSQMSPRMVLGQTSAAKKLGRYAAESVAMFKKMTPQAAKEALQNETFMRAVFTQTLQSHGEEDEDLQAILQEVQGQ